VPDSTSMRRAASAALVAVALLLVTACGSAKATPGVAKDNFTPKAELVLHSCGVPSTQPEDASTCTQSDLVVTKPGAEVSGPVLARVPAGSVLLVKNVDSHDRRVSGSIKDAPVFDTGIMHPGESTTIVLDLPGTVTISDATMGLKTTLEVVPQADSKG
jgi:hypothetical protein